MELVRRTIDTVVELLPTSSQSGQSVSCDSKPVARDDNCKVEEIRFTDDLRTEDFNYIVNESSNFLPTIINFSLTSSCVCIHSAAAPQAPQPGNIVFHHGNGAVPPTMTWQYGEPRAITKMYILPVPFTITTEDDAPVDIKVRVPISNSTP